MYIRHNGTRVTELWTTMGQEENSAAILWLLKQVQVYGMQQPSREILLITEGEVHETWNPRLVKMQDVVQ